MTSSIVLTRTRHLFARKHVVWAISCKNKSSGSAWAQDREKRTGHDTTGQSKKSQSHYISPIWGEAPTEPIWTKICTVVAVPDAITCANVWTEIFSGYGFTWGWISHIFIDSCMCLATVQRYALPVMCWTFPFLACDVFVRTNHSAIAMMFVRLSVCLSVCLGRACKFVQTLMHRFSVGFSPTRWSIW